MYVCMYVCIYIYIHVYMGFFGTGGDVAVQSWGFTVFGTGGDVAVQSWFHRLRYRRGRSRPKWVSPSSVQAGT